MGMSFAVAQLVVAKSEFCCNTKFNEGMIQEMMALPPEGVMLNRGVGTDADV